MAHLVYQEMLSCVDSFLIALFGPENYLRWKSLKHQVNVKSEKEFVSWVLDTFEQCYESQFMKRHDPNQQEDYEQANMEQHQQHHHQLQQHHQQQPEQYHVYSKQDECHTHEQTYMAPTEGFQMTEGQHTHNVGAKTISCKKCTVSFPNATALRIHNREIHGSKNNPRKYKCELCSKTYTTRQGLQTHTNMIHKKLKKIRCNVCCETFVTPREKSYHLQLVHPDQVRTHACEFCGKTFRERSGMLKHQRWAHLGIKEHKCQYCDKEFYQASDARKHEANVHMGVRAFQCMTCNRRFATKASLVYHYQKEHETNIMIDMHVD